VFYITHRFTGVYIADQEKSNDSEIAQFCQLNYGVTFPVTKKGVVVKQAVQQEVL
jgi:glutathione peroxidase